MSQVIPEGEAVRNAVKWISSERKEHNNIKIFTLIQQASTKYNLSPREEEFLYIFYLQKTGKQKKD